MQTPGFCPDRSGYIEVSEGARRVARLEATGVPRSAETAPPQDPTVGLCLGLYGGPSSLEQIDKWFASHVRPFQSFVFRVSDG